MTNYWMHPITAFNWDIETGSKQFLLGINKRWKGLHDQLCEGDFVVYYIMGKSKPKDIRAKKIAGIFKIAANPYEDITPIWPDGIYPLRAKLEPVMYGLEPHHMLPIVPLIEHLTFITNKQYWGTALQIGLIRISKSDFTLIRNELSKLIESTQIVKKSLKSSAFIPSHTSVEWALVFMGRNSGYDVWITRQDRGKRHQGNPIGNESLQDLPDLGLGKNVKNIIENIDVLWLRKNKVVAAFEVEHSTNIQSGLTRLNDLVLAAPNLSINLYIVASDERKSKFKKEISRPSFEGLQTKAQFIPYSKISEKLASAEKIIELGGKLTDRFLIDEAEHV